MNRPKPAHGAPTQLDLFQDAFPVIEPRRIIEMPPPVLIGCAGWQVPSRVSEHFHHEAPVGAGHLERYASVLPAVEINTSFYRPHLPATYARWRDSVPPDFRFSVKMPRTLTHEARLQDTDGTLNRFLDEVRHLGDKLGCLLVQLPPSLAYDAFSATLFFDQLTSRIDVPVVCEPRHSSWFSEAAARMLAHLKIAYVRADPPPVARPIPDSDSGLVYVRLHGRPVIYRSAYADGYLETLAAELAAHYRQGRKVWCVFDNTAEGHAMPNALSLIRMTEKETGMPIERRRRVRKMPRD